MIQVATTPKTGVNFAALANEGLNVRGCTAYSIHNTESASQTWTKHLATTA